MAWYFAILVYLVAAACVVPPSPEQPPFPLPGSEPPPCALESTLYRVDDIQVPELRVGFREFSLNLDGAQGGYPQNAGGNSITALQIGESVNQALRLALQDGRLVWILEVETCTDSAHLRLGSYQILDDDTELSLLRGDLVPAVGSADSGRLSARDGVGSLPTSAFFDPLMQSQIEWSDGDALGFELERSADGALSGVIAIGLREDRRQIIANALAPLLTLQLQQGEELVVGWYDLDGDGEVVSDEIVDSWWLDPDIDLFAIDDGSMVYWPRSDNEVDRMSLGVRVHAVAVAD